MVHKALIVEDHPDYQHQMKDVVHSLGHSCDTTDTLEGARQLLESGQYTYHLLDLEIPVKSAHSNPHIENGMNLLREINDRNGFLGPPSIIVTGHGKNTHELATRTFHLGAVHYVTKPFRDSDKTLDSAIRQAISIQKQRCRDNRRLGGSNSSKKSEGIAFEGGDLEIREEGIWLCGVKILTDRGYQTTMLIEALSRRDDRDQYIPCSGEQLAQIIEASGGITTITSTVSHIRRMATKALQQCASTTCGKDDLIVHNGQGYYFRDWIDVIDHRQESILPDLPQPEIDFSGLTSKQRERYLWVLKQLKSGVRLRRIDIEKERKVCSKTVKTDLKYLREQGLIEFVSKPWPGYYRLVRAK